MNSKSSAAAKASVLKVIRQTAASPDATSPTALATATNAAPTVASADIPQSITNWLARLTLLYGLPFEYMVPDANMLPPESIRFFYLDNNWTNRLVDGAVNIGLGSSQDAIQKLKTFEQLAHQTALRQNAIRAQLRDKAEPETGVVGGSLGGLLLRSAVVKGWPGLEVNAFSDEAGTQPINLLRMDRLSENVLICLFSGIPQRVDFSEPPEGLHFGVIKHQSSPQSYEVALRGVGVGNYPAGEQIKENEQAITSPVAFRKSRQDGVLDITQTQQQLATHLDHLGALEKQGEKPVFTSSQFAVQMVRGAGLQTFKQSTLPKEGVSKGKIQAS